MHRILNIIISLMMLIGNNFVLVDGALAAKVTVKVNIRHYSSVEDFSSQPGYSADEGCYIDLLWKNPAESIYKGTVIRVRQDHYPLHQYDGEEIYNGTVTYRRHSGLVSGKIYYYAAFAYNQEYLYSLATRVSAITPVLCKVKAKIKTPKDGKKLKGNSLTVMAKIVEGSLSDVKHVLFEYKKSGSTDWLPIPVSNNPDSSSPYIIRWNISKLEEYEYNLRARATDIDGVSDLDPASITIIINERDPDIEEWANREGKYYKRVKLLNSGDNRVVIARENMDSLTEVNIRQGSLNSNASVVKVIVNPEAPPSAQKWMKSVGEYLSVELENGQSLFSESKPVKIIIPYRDDDDDGMIDGTNISEKRLTAMCYRPGWKIWKRDFGVEVNEVENTVTITTAHLSLFGLFSSIANDLNNVIVYPNPFKPYVGHEEICFKGLTEETTIKIYNIAGELVKEIEDVEGETVWDARNNYEKNVASGIYIYVIVNDKGNKRIGKLAIIK